MFFMITIATGNGRLRKQTSCSLSREEKSNGVRSMITAIRTRRDLAVDEDDPAGREGGLSLPGGDDKLGYLAVELAGLAQQRVVVLDIC